MSLANLLNSLNKWLQVGDVIYIEANSGASKRIGRSDAFATEFDLEAEEYVPLPKGDVHKRKEVIQVRNHKLVIITIPHVGHVTIKPHRD